MYHLCHNRKRLALATVITLLSLTPLFADSGKTKYSESTRSRDLPHYLADYHYQTAPLTPTDLTDFFVAPEKKSMIGFKLNKIYDWQGTSKLAYRIFNYQGEEVASGAAKVKDGLVETELSLPQGFFELEFTEVKERFGICVLPKHQGKVDPYFGIGIYFTFYMRSEFREPLIKNLNWMGIGVVRDISKWDDLNPGKGVWREEANVPPGRFAKAQETLRRTLKQHGIGMLEFAPDSPKWIKNAPNSEFPADLIEATVAWREWASRWRSYWDCFQVWNEPNHDGHKGNVAEFSAVVKAFAWAGQQEQVRITNGGFSFLDRNYIRQCRNNGVMDSISFVSLHIYDNSASAPGILSGLRALVPHRELWITETSSGFFRESIFDKRPKAEKAASMVYANCLDNAINAVECRVAGVSRYFPFSTITWPTDKIQMRNRRLYGNGCIDYHYTPLHYMAVYAQIVRTLSGKQFVGKMTFKSGITAKIFADDQSAIIVLIGKPGQRLIAQEFPISNCRLEGIDGRNLKKNGKDAILEDGIAYMEMPKAELDRCYAGRIAAAPKYPAPEPVTAPLSPIILQPVFAAKESYSVTKCYLKLNRDADRNFKLKIRINNLSNTEEKVCLAIKTSPETRIRHNLPETISVPPLKFAEITLDGELTDQAMATGEYQVVMAGTDSANRQVLPICFALRVVSDDLSFFRKGTAKAVNLNPANLKPWKTNHIFKGGKMELSLNAEKDLVVKASFPDYKGYRTWATPTIPFTNFAGQFTPDSIIVVRGKLQKHNCIIKLTLWEKDGSRYETALPINDVNREGWQVMPVYVSDFLKSTGELDENQKLDTDRIVKFGIVIACPHKQEMPDNELTVSDILIVSPDK